MCNNSPDKHYYYNPWINVLKLYFETHNSEKHSKKNIKIKIATKKFDKGAMRECFFTRDENNDLYVIKKYINTVSDKIYIGDMIIQQKCNGYANLFNEQKGVTKKIKFIPVGIICFPATSTKGARFMTIEPYINGRYVKHNNNVGWCNPITRNTPHAFSHFTYTKSKGEIIIVDIQGVNDYYTDPQIHTREKYAGKDYYGLGNLGVKGIDEFMKSHWCNSICRSLGISRINSRAIPIEGFTKMINDKPYCGLQRNIFHTENNFFAEYPRLKLLIIIFHRKQLPIKFF